MSALFIQVLRRFIIGQHFNSFLSLVNLNRYQQDQLAKNEDSYP